MSDIRTLPRVAAVATLARRREDFKKVLPVIYDQVDHVFVYLDAYDAIPDFLDAYDNLTVHLCEEIGAATASRNMHASTRFLCLREIKRQTVVVIFDDDIVYPPNYVSRMTETLHEFDGQAVVGVHGRRFTPPHRSYLHDATMSHFSGKMSQHRDVHEVGMGTSAFVSDRFPVDPTQWESPGMDDINAAYEAQRRDLRRIVIARPEGWLRPIAEKQSDSLWASRLRDDAAASRLMRRLLGLYHSQGEALDDMRQSAS